MGKTHYNTTTRLPNDISSRLALEILQAHEEVIMCNPLVTGVEKIDTPRDAPTEEFFESQWYRITEVITWGFGLKKRLSFQGCFHDLPNGVQTHMYCPMGVDLKQRFVVGGARDFAVSTTDDGLYLREDVEITCAAPLTSFVKKETKAATGQMLDRLRKKAELIEQGRLHATFENGKLKTSKPSPGLATASHVDKPLPSPHGFIASPVLPNSSLALDQQTFGNYHDISPPGHWNNTTQGSPPPPPPTQVFEMAGSMEYSQYPNGLYPAPLDPQKQHFRAELSAGDGLTPQKFSPNPPSYTSLSATSPSSIYSRDR